MSPYVEPAVPSRKKTVNASQSGLVTLTRTRLYTTLLLGFIPMFLKADGVADVPSAVEMRVLFRAVRTD